MWSLLLGLFCISLGNAQFLPFNTRAQDRLTEGKYALELLSRNAHTTPCWKDTIESLVRSCKQIESDDIVKSRFAVQLTNCHLAKSGRDTYSCTKSMSIEECTSAMDTVAFNSYTEFYVASEHICYYLQIEYFQNMTEEKITQLYLSVTDSISFLQSLQTKTTMMHDSMGGKVFSSASINYNYSEDSLDQQKEISSNMGALHTSLESTRTSVDTLNVKSDKIKTNVDYTLQNQGKIAEAQLLLLEEQKRSADETHRKMSELFSTAEGISTSSVQSLVYQKQLIDLQAKTVEGIIGLGEMADQTIAKQRELLEGQRLLEQEHERAREFYVLILTKERNERITPKIIEAEFLDVHAVIFYFVAAVLAFLCTTTNQTHSARFWLFASLPLFLGFEVLLRSRGWDTIDTFYTHHQNIWLFRTRVVPVYAALILLRSIWSYTDQTKLLLASQSMLVEVLQAQNQLNQMMKSIVEHQELMGNRGLKGEGGCARARGYSTFLGRLSPFREERDESHLVVISDD